MYLAKAAVIEHLEKLIKNSTYNNFGDRKTNDPPNVVGYLNFKSKLTIDGEKRHVRVSLRLDRDKTTKFKSYEIGKKEKQVKPARAAVANPEDGLVKPVLKNKDSEKRHVRISVEVFKDKKTLLKSYELGKKKPHLSKELPKLSSSPNEVSKDKDTKNQSNSKKQPKKTDKKGLSNPEPTPETLHKVTQPYTKPNQNKKIRNIGVQTETNSDFFNVPGEVGKFFQVIERKPVHSVVITLDGHQGGGKTTFLYQIMDAFAAGGHRGVFLSLEEHPDSHLAREKAQKYISPQNTANLDTLGDLENVDELYSVIADYDIVYIDSWQKLQEMVGKIRMDKDLRKRFDGKVFVIIFQQTTTGRTKGGSEVVFDGDIITKLVKESKFQDNYAYFDKNRYTRVPLETIRYNIFQARTYNPEGGEPVKKADISGGTAIFGNLKVTEIN